MNGSQLGFKTGVVQPIECLKLGWNLIRDQYWLMLGVTFIGMLIANLVPFGILMGPMMCGIYYCMFRRMRGEKVVFEMLFKGFDNFVQSLIATLIMIVPFIVILVPLYIAFIVFFTMTMGRSGADPGNPGQLMAVIWPVAAIAMIVVFALILVIGVLFIFAYPLIADRGLSGVEAIKASARAAWANVGGLAGLFLLNVVLGMAGMCLCYVGAIFVMPVTFAGLAVAYSKVFGLEAVAEINAAQAG